MKCICLQTIQLGKGIVTTKQKGNQRQASTKRKSAQDGHQKFCAQWESRHRGPTSLRIVPENVKVNNEVFLKEVLIPIWKEDIPRLYPGEERKVNLHMDGARAHFHPNVVQLLETNQIKYIPATHWPTNSPNVPSMEYRIHGIFKQFW